MYLKNLNRRSKGQRPKELKSTKQEQRMLACYALQGGGKAKVNVSIFKTMILSPVFNPHGKQAVFLWENCSFLIGEHEFSHRETHETILSVKPVVKFLVTIECNVIIEACAAQGI